MNKKFLTNIAFIFTIGLSQSATVSTLSMDTGMYEAVGIAKDDVGYLYMGDTNGKIQRINQTTGATKLLVANSSWSGVQGCNGASGCVDYNFADRFWAIWVSPDGTTMYAGNSEFDTPNHSQSTRKERTRKYTLDGDGNVLSSEMIAEHPNNWYIGGIDVDAAGNVYVGHRQAGQMSKIKTDGSIHTLTGQTGELYEIIVTEDGSTLYTVSRWPDYQVTMFEVGSELQLIEKTRLAGGTQHNEIQDGVGTDAWLRDPYGCAMCPNGSIYFTDRNTIRKVTFDGTADMGIVENYVNPADVSGNADGPAGEATLKTPKDLVCDANNVLYVVQQYNSNVVRIVTPVVFRPQTKAELQTAVDMWVDDNATALATYGEINTWDVSVVTDMSGLFQNKTTFNDDIGDWDVSNVTDMNKMFYTSDHSGIFNQDISGWDVSSVTDMNTMFKNNHVFNQDISGWDVSSVTNMSDMFKYTENLETDLSNWDVSNVTHMGTMFFHAENIIFSEGFASWDVSNVTNFGYMFIETTFNMDISSWDVSSATNMSGMFLQTNISDENKCAIHTSFSSNGNWPYDWSGLCPTTFQPQTKAELQTAVDMWVDDNAAALSTYGEINTWDVSVVTDMSGLFQDKTTFNDDIGDWNVSNVTNMTNMFGGWNGSNFNQDISSWDVSSVTNMSAMFHEAGNFNQDISNWDVSSVTEMGYMFRNTDAFNQDLSSWDVSNVESMYEMFAYSNAFNGDISNWNVSNVTNMVKLFGYSNFNQNISGWDVSNVTNMSEMFKSNDDFNGDISNWDVSSVTDMTDMFDGATGLSDENQCAIHTAFSTNSNWPYDWSGSCPPPMVTSVEITGTSGYRFLSSPVSGAIYGDLLDELWTQGSAGSDMPESSSSNVWTWNNSWNALTDLATDNYTAGSGVLVYVFADTDFDGTDNLPVTLTLNGTQNTSPVTIATNTNSWNLLGNPYGYSLSIQQLAVDNAGHGAVYIWDNTTTAYKIHNGTTGDIADGLIAPFQGFWSQANAGAASYTFSENSISSDAGTNYRTTTDDSTGSAVFTFINGANSSSVYLSFNLQGQINLDPADASRLLPMEARSHMTSMIHESGKSLSINNLPYDLSTDISMDMDVMMLSPVEGGYTTEEQDVTMQWDLSNIPEGMVFTLIDNTTGQTIDLDALETANITLPNKGILSLESSGFMGTYPELGQSQFTLTIQAATTATDADPVPDVFALHRAYPNPFNPSTLIGYDLSRDSHVSLEIFDLNGRSVKTLINGYFRAGKHQVAWNADQISSGIYLVRLVTGKKVFNQKITYLK